MAREQQPDRLTLDLSRPGRNAGEVVELLRKDKELSDLRICIITGRPELRGLIFTFESLLQADDAGLQELLKNVDSAKVALALYEAPEELAERFFSNLSERAGSMLREEIEFISSVKPEDQAAARKDIVDMALQLESEDKLTFSEGEEEE